jgi:hypothetical protein
MGKEKQQIVTDWAAFYRNQGMARKLSAILGIRSILHSVVRYAGQSVKIITELGGANTPYYKPLREQYPDAGIITLDREPDSDENFLQTVAKDTRFRSITIDLLRDDLPDHLLGCSDIVFSTGFIEHFSPRDTAELIRRHFALCRPGGLVIITFPTPSIFYRTLRSLLTLAKKWRFYDERPLSYEEVAATMSQHGELVERKLDFRLGLTQGKLGALKR